MRRLAWPILALLLAPGRAVGQSAPTDGPAGAKVEGAGNATAAPAAPAGTFVNTRFEADEAILRCKRLAGAGQWREAAILVQAAVDNQGEYLTRRDDARFISVRRALHDLVCGWPEAGVAAYRAAQESTARSRLDAVTDPTDAEARIVVGERYFPTQAGAEALDAAAELAVERGDFAAARRDWGRLAALHPDRAKSGLIWRGKAAIAAAWGGDSAELNAIAKELTESSPGPVVDWGGKQQTLRAAMTAARRGLRDDQTTPVAVRPGLFGDGPARRFDVPTAALPEAVLWRCPLPDLSGIAPTAPGETAGPRVEARKQSLQSGRLLSVAPVTGGGLVYLHHATSVWAVDPARPDAPAWRFDLVAPLTPSEAKWLPEDEIPPLFTALYDDGRLYAHLDREAPAGGEEGAKQVSLLVCLDAATGREVWRNDLAGFATQFEKTRLDGAPIRVGRSLFAVARRRKPFGFESCFLLRFDRASGRITGTTHLGEAPTGSYGYHRATLSHAASDGDRLYVHTNLGTVAAVRAATMAVDWLRRYESRYAADADGGWPARSGRQPRAWQFQPTMLWRDRVVCAPLDDDNLRILDAADGAEVARVPADRLDHPETIVGIAGERLILAGNNVTAFDLSTGKVAWSRPLPDGRLFGRGAVTATDVLIPTDKALLRIPLDGGPPAARPWDLERAGNLAVQGESIVVAAPEAVYGLVRKGDAYAALEHAAEAAPKDPLPMARLAELAIEVGDDARAMAAARQAVSRAGKPERLRDPALKTRIYDLHLRLAETRLAPARATGLATSRPASGLGLDETRAAEAIDLLAEAGRFAPTAAQRVRQRMVLAETLVWLDRAADAVSAYQDILADKALRETLWTPPGAGDSAAPVEPAPAGEFARAAIERLATEKGPGVVASIETQADGRLKDAVAKGDLEALAAIADTFPTTRAAGQALVAHGRRSAERADGRIAAARSYRRALALRDCPDRAEVMAALAGVLIADERLDAAEAWLERGQRDHAGAKVKVGDRAVTFQAWREEMRANLTVAGLPAVNWPVSNPYNRLHPDRVTVLEAEGCEARAGDPLMIYSGKALTAFDAAADKPLWPRAVACPTQPAMLRIDAQRCILTTATRVFALNRADGGLAWQFGEEDAADPDSDPESRPAWVDHAVTADAVVCVNDHREIVCLGAADGQLRWRREDGPRGSGTLAVDDRRVVYIDTQSRSCVLRILAIGNGEPLAGVPIDDSRPVQAVRLVPGGPIIAATSAEIVAVDPKTYQIAWRGRRVENLILSTLQAGPEGLYVSTNGRGIARYDLDTGRKLGETPPIGHPRQEGLWTALYGATLYAASDDALMAFDAADMRMLWQAAEFPGLMVQSPRVSAEDIVVIALANEPPTTQRAVDGSHGADGPRRFQIRRYRRADGREGPVLRGAAGDETPLVTEPLGSFGGLSVRDHALLLLDGPRVLGYVDSTTSAK